MTRRILGPADGVVLGPPAGVRDRYLVDSEDWAGNVAVVEHLLAPHSIAAPVHRHSREDEFSLVLQGRLWVVADGAEHVAQVGDLVFKPRGEWHTFFNASDEPARILEIISPGGLEEAFKVVAQAPEDFDLEAYIAEYGCDLDLEATDALVAKYGLTFG